MKSDWQNKWLVHLVFVLTLLVFGYKSSVFLHNDFWQDEIYTLQHFVFVPWKTVLTDYHSTNNHILFSVLVKALTGLAGMHSLVDAIETPYLVRAVPFFFALLSVIFFYRGMLKHYGRSFALTGVSVFCTSIVFVDFAVQLRGYSLSILITVLLLFAFIDFFKNDSNRWHVFILFLLNGLNLLCLPTNIYLSVAILFFCLLLFIRPEVAVLFFNKKVQRRRPLLAALAVIASTAVVLIYYRWLLQLQPENPLISSFNIASLKNAVQALAVFYHFTDYRFYLFIFLLLWLISFVKKGEVSFSTLFLPATFFFVPFLFFFLHGAIIIQRTFLPLIPFFAMIIAAAVTELSVFNRYRYGIISLCLANVIILGITFNQLLTSSKQNNNLSIHKHDLRSHYYLVNFNARQAALLAQRYASGKDVPVYLWDDFGGTGIEYYLAAYKIPFAKYRKDVNLRSSAILISNNKKTAEIELANKRLQYKKLLRDEEQYNLYLIKGN